MKKVFWLTLSLSLCLAVSAGSLMAAEKVRGVTDTEILVGQWGPQTGPAALWGAVASGTGVLFELVNSEGGIHGRKIKYFLRDDSYQPAKTKAIGKEFIEDIGVFAVVGGVGTSCGMAVRDDLMKNKVVWVSPSSGSTHWIDPFQKYLFAVYPLYIHEAYLLTQYATEKMGKKKIAFFYQNDDYGKQGLDGAQKYAKEKGIKLVAEVPERGDGHRSQVPCHENERSRRGCCYSLDSPKARRNNPWHVKGNGVQPSVDFQHYLVGLRAHV